MRIAFRQTHRDAAEILAEIASRAFAEDERIYGSADPQYGSPEPIGLAWNQLTIIRIIPACSFLRCVHPRFHKMAVTAGSLGFFGCSRGSTCEEAACGWYSG